MKLQIILTSTLLFSNIVKANDSFIVDVKKNIPLSDHEISYRDYYISLGDGSSQFKKNLIVQVLRKSQIRDTSGAHSFGEVQIPVGQLKIIAIFDKVAVAREFKLFDRSELPVLDQPGILNGDKIDVKNSFFDSNKSSQKSPQKEET